ncbi:Ig-like domain-containing protein [Sphingomonas sp. I4]
MTVTASDTLPIDAATAAALTARYGRVVNTTATVAPQSIGMEQARALDGARVTLGYSDGSTATRAVDWDAEDLARLTRPGRYLVHGAVRQRRYPAIFAYNRADPDIYRWEHEGRVRYLSSPPTTRTTTMSALCICRFGSRTASQISPTTMAAAHAKWTCSIDGPATIARPRGA